LACYLDPSADLVTDGSDVVEVLGRRVVDDPVFVAFARYFRVWERLGQMTYGPCAGQWRDVVFIERRSRLKMTV
jgi:hypothetical protein